MHNLFGIKLIILRSKLRMLNVYEFVWTFRSSARVVFNNFLLIDATDRSKISSDQKRLFFASLYPLLFNCKNADQFFLCQMFLGILLNVFFVTLSNRCLEYVTNRRYNKWIKRVYQSCPTGMYICNLNIRAGSTVVVLLWTVPPIYNY